MSKSLRYISISYKTASVIQREAFHVSEDEKIHLAKNICDTFTDIKGLLLLITCNRTEIYFESASTSASTICDFFISLKVRGSIEKNKPLFKYSNHTEDTVRNFLEVSSGLASSVIGDVEIIHQIKKAYQFSIKHQLQGSLLERCMQTIFKSHKRISNETQFRDGTTSIAYKSLKVVNDTYNKASSRMKKILFIGAGDIVNQLFKYNSKFNFNNIYISNRTMEKAQLLAKRHQIKVYDWRKVLSNDFEGFDVIISAVSNRHHLIKRIPFSIQNILLIDLSIPSNIDRALGQNKNIIFHDLDSISAELEDTKERRLAAISEVDQIISEELLAYNEWFQNAALRATFSIYEARVAQKVKNLLEDSSKDYNPQMIKLISNVIMKKLISQNEILIPSEKINNIIIKEELCLNKII